MALNITLAMILSFIESQIPTFVPIPGIKMGLANIAVVFALICFFMTPFALEIRQALVILAFAPVGSAVPGFTGEMGGDVGLSSACNSICMVISIAIIVALLLVML